MRIGYFLTCEDHTVPELLETAKKVEDAGFHDLWISDHFHPWTDRQGSSAFVWSIIGALAGQATSEVRVTTAVTCPTFRIHPAIIAQAAATSACLLPGRFLFGVGSGENLNEHVLGQHWPPTEVRLEMLEEAIELIRRMWTGEIVTHHGRHYTVENARLYTLPDEPPPILVSAFGPKSVELAARIGDGWVTTKPDGEMLRAYRDAGGRGVTQSGLKVCYGSDADAAAELAHELWPTSAIGGELSQELPMPAHFEQAASSVTPEDIASKMPVGPEPDRYVSAVQEYVDAGFDELYVSQIGPDVDGFLRFWADEVAPQLHDVSHGNGARRVSSRG